MKIEKIAINKINPAAYNPRKDLKPSDKEYQLLEKSIEEYGFIEPLIWNKTSGNLVGGHQRLKILTARGDKKVDVSVVELDEYKEKSLNLMLNKVSGSWDDIKLSELLGELSAIPDFDIELTGFDIDEVMELGISGGIGSGMTPAEAKTTLAERFIVPPFSIFDTRQGYWQDRKRAWMGLGIMSEIGRGERLNFKDPGLAFDYDADIAKQSRKAADQRSNLNNAPPEPEYANFNMAHAAPGTSIFDPVLCEVCYTWFNIAGGHIIDPFAGGSVRGIVAEYLGYKYHGMDLSAEQIKANEAQAKALNLTPNWKHGNSLTIDDGFKDISIDFIFTCPPYFDLEIYSENPDDISNMDYESFLKTYQEILSNTASMLKENRFACVVISDVRDKKGYYRDLIGATKKAFEDNGVKFYNDIILINVAGSLPMRVNKQFQAGRKVGRTHQNVLVFYKGDPKKIKSEFGTVVVPDDIEDHPQ